MPLVLPARTTRPAPLNVVIVGTGNAGMQLAVALSRGGHRIVQVCARRPREARRAGRRLGARHTTAVQRVDADADVILLTVPDSAIAATARALPPTGALVVHASGSVPLSALAGRFVRYGVLYPVQTLTRDGPGDLQGVPMCVEANNRSALARLRTLARSMKGKVHVLSSRQRAAVHLAAVFSNNYTNHLVFIAGDILRRHRLPFDLLRPLLAETLNRLTRHRPGDVQTGPARRGDRRVLAMHRRMLATDPQWKKIYAMLARDIIETYR